jgi:predicted subunit of tRNA(5-methylaminomethyl-2-thiouridylate) methyltransferase
MYGVWDTLQGLAAAVLLRCVSSSGGRSGAITSASPDRRLLPSLLESFGIVATESDARKYAQQLLFEQQVCQLNRWLQIYDAAYSFTVMHVMTSRICY